MFDYSKCESAYNIDKDTGRVYKTPDGTYPSITTILSATSNNIYLEKWRQRVGEEEAALITKQATDRGTKVHDYIEKYFLQQAPRSLDDYIEENNLYSLDASIKKPVIDIIRECEKNNFVPYAQEVALWHPKLKYAGRADGIGLWNKVLSIIDFKTSKKKKYNSSIKNYYIQATAYAVAHNYLFDTRINDFAIIIGGDTGLQTFCGKVTSYIPELKYRIRAFYNK